MPHSVLIPRVIIVIIIFSDILLTRVYENILNSNLDIEGEITRYINTFIVVP